MKKGLLSIFLVFCMALMLMPTAMLADSAVITVGSAEAQPGDTVRIPVSITTNPGIGGATFKISYDETALTLVTFQKGLSGNYLPDMETEEGEEPEDEMSNTILWWTSRRNNVMTEGVMLTLEFEVRNNAASKTYPVNVSVDLTDVDSNPVPSDEIQAGAVTVSSSDPGPGPDEPVTYSVTAASAVNGTVTVSPTTAEAGDTITVNATPNSGYEVDTITYATATGAPVTVTGNTFTMPAADVTVNVTFKAVSAPTPDVYTIQVNNPANGTVSVDKTSAKAGEIVEVYVMPADGYGIDTITCTQADGTSVPLTSMGVSIGNTHTFRMPAADVTVNVTFKATTTSPVTYAVTVTKGTASRDSAAENELVTITADNAPSGKRFKEWTGTEGLTFNSGSKTTKTATFRMPARAVNVAATYEDIQEYTVTFNPNGGVVSTASMVTVDNKLTTLPVPEKMAGYDFDGWYTASTGGTRITTSYVFGADTTVYAQWTKLDNIVIPDASEETHVQKIEINIFGAKLELNSNDSDASKKEYVLTLTLPATASRPTKSEIEKAFDVDTNYEARATALNNGWWKVEIYLVTARAETPVATYIIRVEVTDDAETYYISIPSVKNGDVVPSVRYAAQGERVTLSVHPDAGYELDSITVKASNGRTINLTDRGNGQYTFTMPDLRVTVDASFTQIANTSSSGSSTTTSTPADDEVFTGLGTPGISGIVLNPQPMNFTDVTIKSWFYSSVEYMWQHYLMSGVSETQFAPDTTTSRAMIWTILARMNNVRTDVNPGSTWYERGMVWCMENGVTDGTNPMADISREQLATMLWRNAGSPTNVSADMSKFSDTGSVSSYAASAVRWAVANGILQGSDGKLNPQGTATRAQVAAMVARYGDRIGA